jgi:hypothetical protein
VQGLGQKAAYELVRELEQEPVRESMQEPVQRLVQEPVRVLALYCYCGSVC